MNEAMVEKVVRAVLYEGYILYPYRPSVKNRQRWTFGGVYPRAYAEGRKGGASGDNWFMQTQCPAEAGAGAVLRVRVRFLHLVDRRVERAVAPPAGAEATPAFEPVESLEVDGKLFQSWQEAKEREVELDEVPLGDLAACARSRDFTFPARRESELLRESGGQTAGRVVREQRALEGVVELSSEERSPGVFVVTVRLLNRTPLDTTAPPVDHGRGGRDEAMLRAFASSHVILGIRGGAFASLTDPPEALREIATGCVNVGCWPVLVGKAGERDTVLASPIILPDYPQVAPESPGDLFDATEIDEILTLRVMTLTDEEKRQAAAVDDRAREMLARTEALAREQMMNLHGTMRR